MIITYFCRNATAFLHFFK